MGQGSNGRLRAVDGGCVLNRSTPLTSEKKNHSEGRRPGLERNSWAECTNQVLTNTEAEDSHAGNMEWGAEDLRRMHSAWLAFLRLSVKEY